MATVVPVETRVEKKGGNLPPVALVLLNAVFLAVLLTASHGIMKWISSSAHDGIARAVLHHWLALSVALGIYVFIFAYYLFALRIFNLSVLYPMYTGLSVLLVFVLGVAFFGEPIGGLKILGCILVVLGVVFVAW